VLRTVRSREIDRHTERIGACRVVSAMSSGRSRCALTKGRCALSCAAALSLLRTPARTSLCGPAAAHGCAVRKPAAALRAACLRAVLRGCARRE